MASYTKNTPGAPDSGRYSIDDTVTDSIGTVYKCIKAGQAERDSFLALSGEAMSTDTIGGAGVTGSGGVYKTSVERIGGVIKTTILADLTGLASVATDNDIVGVGATAAHFGRITAAQNGTIVGGRMTCLETPVGGEVDLNLWSANEGTGVLDDLITGLTGEITPVDRAGDWAAGDVQAIGAVVPAAGQYLYLAVGTSSTPTAGTYTAGKFLIELYGV